MAIKLKRKNPLWSIHLLFLPLALSDGLITFVRNKLYDWKVIRTARFNIPIIGVGNLSVGGTGKTPHTEYLIRKLNPYLDIAVLSRGYGRKSIGWQEVTLQSDSAQAGDEPLVMKLKYPDLPVFVGENRVTAIPESLRRKPSTQLLILDDVFQHRSISPDINLLLTEYEYLYKDDFIMPVGSLREWSSGAERADSVIVTKCPNSFSKENELAIQSKLNLRPHQALFFSKYIYGHPYRLFNHLERINLDHSMEVILFSALAGTNYIISYLQDKVKTIHSMEHPDHHQFREGDLGELHFTYQQLEAENKIILITEKDAVKLIPHRDFIIKNQLPIFILPAEVTFTGSNALLFDQYIKSKILEYEA